MKSAAAINWTEELKTEAKAWSAEGKSRRWIARQLRERGLTCSRNAVIGMLWRLGIRSPHSPSMLSTLGHQTRRDEIRSNIDRRINGKTDDRHKSLVSNIYRERKERARRWREAIQKGAPEPLRIPAGDLERWHCKSVITGETGDRCEPLYCGHQVGKNSFGEDTSWCAYHWARYTRLERL